MEIALKRWIIIGAAVLFAVALGWQVAHGAIFLGALVSAVLLLWIGSRLTSLAPDALAAGLVLLGYLIGNRGFAQLHPPGVPLLPGELALGLGLALGAWRAAHTKALPVRRAVFDGVLLAWLAFGAVRLRFDFRVFGFMSVRDFAMIYYALFFFLAQGWATDEQARGWLVRCLTLGFAFVGPVAVAFAYWPDLFIAHTTVLGSPLIFVKSDVAGGFMVAATIWFLDRHRRTGRWFWLLFALPNFAGVLLGNSRAAVAALAAVVVWTVVCRDWRLLRPLGTMLAAGLALVLLAAVVSSKPWPQTTAYRIFESATSMTDFSGEKRYLSPDLADKSDNNQFRLVWWQTVAAETLERAPWLGLGFGYDLADQFTRVYYAEGSEEFSARSPHNFVLTVFGRMGIVGLALFLTLVAVLARQTWQAGRRAAQDANNGEGFAWRLGAWAILTSACFGVVLEGPMGAVVFWTLLGLANAPSLPSTALLVEETASFKVADTATLS